MTDGPRGIGAPPIQTKDVNRVGVSANKYSEDSISPDFPNRRPTGANEIIIGLPRDAFNRPDLAPQNYDADKDDEIFHEHEPEDNLIDEKDH